jgi:hypothetical protein
MADQIILTIMAIGLVLFVWVGAVLCGALIDAHRAVA